MRTIKDRNRSDFSGTPIRKIPDIVTIALGMAAAFWIPDFPSQDSVSLTLRP